MCPEPGREDHETPKGCGERDGVDGRDRRDHPGRRDVDAEFAALVQGVGGTGTGGASSQGGSGAAGRPDPADDPDSAATGSASPSPAPDTSGGPGHERELTPEQEAEVAALAAALETGAGEGQPGGEGAQPPRAVKVAVVVTPVAGAEALAALCAMSDLDCTAVPTSSGALAVKQLVSAHSEWDIAELVGGAETEPAEAAELAASLSRLSRAGVVLMTADLATDVGIESGLSGTITARRYVGGQPGEDASAGLLLASMDQVVEDVLLGITSPQDVPGAVRSTEVRPSRTMRWLGRGLRRPPRS